MNNVFAHILQSEGPGLLSGLGAAMLDKGKPMVKPTVGRAPIASFKKGTDRVPKTGVYKLHKDEAVLNKGQADDYRGSKNPAYDAVKDVMSGSSDTSDFTAMNKALNMTSAAVLVMKFAHWNVKGEGFHPTHLLFDEMYSFLAGAADTIAERIRALKGQTEGLPEQVAEYGSEFKVPADQSVDSYIAAMADLMQKISDVYRESAKSYEDDLFTQDVFIELGRESEKLLYFLNATLNK